MAKPTGMIHVDAHLERLIDGFRPIDREHREQLLHRQGMFAAHALNRRNQEFGARLNGKSCQTGDIASLLPDCHGLHEPGIRIDDRARQQFRLFLIADVRAQFRKFLQHDVINLIVDYRRLLGGTDGSVIEGFGEDDVRHSRIQVSRFFQIDRSVARPHTQGWFAGAIGGFDCARPAGGINQPYVFVPHQVRVVQQGVRFQAAKNPFGRAMLQRGLIHDLHGLGAATPRVWMRTENHRVARLDGHDAFEEHG